MALHRFHGFQKSDISNISSFEFDSSQNVNNRNVFRCFAYIGFKKYRLTYDSSKQETIKNISLRDKYFGNDCPGQAILASLTPELTDHQREAFCLSYDDEAENYLGFEVGERDAYLICREPSRTFCQRVNDSKDAAIAFTGLAAGAVAGTTMTAAAAEVTAVTHSSGAVILTGSAGYIAGTLGTVGSSVVAILTAPATLTAAAVTVVAVGGAVYVCN